MRLLQDERSGLCHHAYDSGRDTLSGVFWGRGQGWALLGLVDTLCALPTDASGRPELVQRLERLADALARHQDSTGHWHTVVDDADSYLESSVVAFFVAAILTAVEHELLPADRYLPSAVRAWDAVRAMVDENGVLQGVSAETPTTLSPSAYRRVPLGGPFPWGQGPLSLAATAVNSSAATARVTGTSG